VYSIIRNTLASASLICAPALFAAVNQQVVVTTKVNPASTVGKLELNATFDTKGDFGLKITDPKNPNKAAYDHFIKTLAGFGEILPGFETGPARHSVRVLVDSIKDGVSVTESSGEQPAVVTNFLRIHNMLTPYRKDLEQLNLSQLFDKYNGNPYVQLKFASEHEINRFLFCVSLDYQANVAGSIKLPDFVRQIMTTECTEVQAGLDFVEKSSTVANSTVQITPPGIDLDDYPDYWLPRAFSSSFNLCENLDELDSMAQAGWMDASLPVTTRQYECMKYLQVNVVSRLDKAVTLGMNSSVLKKNITPYYRALLNALLKQGAAEYALTAQDLEKTVSEVVRSSLTVANGFTASEVQSTDFNTQAFMKAIEKPVSDPNSLLVILLSAPEGRSTPLREELAEVDNANDLDAYMNILKAALATACKVGQVNPSCLYSGVTKISSSQSRVVVQSGVEGTQIWSGHLLFKPAGKIVP
jgi:hypothetical protein